MVHNWRNKVTTAPNDLYHKDAFSVKVVAVAVVGAVGDFTAYMGPADWSDEEVAARGDRVPERVGRELFHVCRLLRYRT